MRGCSTNEAKKGEIGKMFLWWRFDVCALSEPKLNGKGEVVGRVSGVAVGRAREGVALLLSGLLMRCHPGLCGLERERERARERSELSECVGDFGRNESVVVLADLNARVGNEVIEGIVGRHGVPGRNESGDRLLEMCAEQELVVGNSWWVKKMKMAEGRC